MRLPTKPVLPRSMRPPASCLRRGRGLPNQEIWVDSQGWHWGEALALGAEFTGALKKNSVIKIHNSLIQCFPTSKLMQKSLINKIPNFEIKTEPVLLIPPFAPGSALTWHDAAELICCVTLCVRFPSLGLFSSLPKRSRPKAPGAPSDSNMLCRGSSLSPGHGWFLGWARAPRRRLPVCIREAGKGMWLSTHSQTCSLACPCAASGLSFTSASPRM